MLISLDTTRWDALSVSRADYGPQPWQVKSTPNLDVLASEGVRFTQFFSHAPSTLNSHVSMLSGLDPHQHQVPRNGFQIQPFTGLAHQLQAAGYQTVAVVGSSALSSSTGINQGFEVFDEQFDGAEDVASSVVERALRRVETGNSKPLFLFVHFYDAHAPYEAPKEHTEAFVRGPVATLPTSRGALASHISRCVDDELPISELHTLTGRYLAEVHFVDEQIGSLLEGLKGLGRLEDTLVVVTADHGETLGDNAPHCFSHGTSVGREVMNVPLIFWGTGESVLPTRVVLEARPMWQLSHTIQAAVGVSPHGSEDFSHLLSGPSRARGGWPDSPSEAIFMEATRPRRVETEEVWNNLHKSRGVVVSNHAMYSVPFLSQPPTALPSLPFEPQLVGTQQRLLQRWDAAAPPFRREELSEQTRASLKALGYLSDP